MTGFPDWQALRNHLIHQLNGETPNPVTEQTIIDAYEQHPDAVEKAAQQTIAAYTAGNIRSGWAILKHRATQILNPPANPTGAKARNAEKQTARAAQWIRNAGLYTPTWEECYLGLVDDLHLEPAQANSLRALYDELHPHGVEAEHAAIARAEQWKATRAKVEAASRSVSADLDDTPIPA